MQKFSLHKYGNTNGIKGGSPAKRKGAILILTLVFSTIFLIIGGGLLSLINYQLKLSRIYQAKAISLHIAEAGVNYYRWHLAHAPNDYADGTGQTGCSPCGPYVHDYEGIGQFSLEITPPPNSSTVVTIKSTGSVYNYPQYTRMVVTKYGIPSLARYSFMTNTNIWFGPSESVIGPLHANGGVRMDGTNNNSVLSAKQTYECTSEHGCDLSNCSSPCTWTALNYCECPGVWGTGSDANLWSYPVTLIDYTSITSDLNDIQDAAEAD